MSETRDLFATYERTVLEVARVATVTAENVGQLAALVGGSVDYSEGEPVLVVKTKSSSSPWRIPLGFQVKHLEGVGLVNMNGFNQDGSWKRARPTGTDA